MTAPDPIRSDLIRYLGACIRERLAAEQREAEALRQIADYDEQRAEDSYAESLNRLMEYRRRRLERLGR